MYLDLDKSDIYRINWKSPQGISNKCIENNKTIFQT